MLGWQNAGSGASLLWPQYWYTIHWTSLQRNKKCLQTLQLKYPINPHPPPSRNRSLAIMDFMHRVLFSFKIEMIMQPRLIQRKEYVSVLEKEYLRYTSRWQADRFMCFFLFAHLYIFFKSCRYCCKPNQFLTFLVCKYIIAWYKLTRLS